MKTIHKILITLGLVLLCFAGCESDLTGVKETDLKGSTLSLYAMGDNQISLRGELNVADSFSFTGCTDVDNVSYGAYVSIGVWQGDVFTQIGFLDGQSEINGFHKYYTTGNVVISLTLMRLSPVLDTANINILNIK